MRKVPTDAEHKLWQALRNRQLNGMKFRRQVPIGNYVPDFVCFEAKLIVELDGSQHADNTYDVNRDAWFRQQGFTILRFWNPDVLTRFEDIVETILRAAVSPSSDTALSGRATFSHQGRRKGERP